MQIENGPWPTCDRYNCSYPRLPIGSSVHRRLSPKKLDIELTLRCEHLCSSSSASGNSPGYASVHSVNTHSTLTVEVI